MDCITFCFLESYMMTNNVIFYIYLYDTGEELRSDMQTVLVICAQVAARHSVFLQEGATALEKNMFIFNSGELSFSTHQLAHERLWLHKSHHSLLHSSSSSGQRRRVHVYRFADSQQRHCWINNTY